MRDGRLEIGFGGLFAGVGIFVTILCLKYVNTPEGSPGMWFGVVVGVLFAAVGSYVLYTGIRAAAVAQKALREGKHYPAVIVAYDADNSARVNGQPLLMLVVRFFDDQERLREEQVKTGDTRRKPFPIGGMVEIAETPGGGDVFLACKKALMEKVPRQDELMNPAAQVQNSLGMTMVGTGVTATAAVAGGAMQVACPSCGAVSSILPGTTLVCPCGRQFTLTSDHMIV